MSRKGRITCSIGIMAHNEAANIGNLFDALIDQRLDGASIEELIVVASGCSDGTEELVRQYAKLDSRIGLLIQPRREGKASAVNLFIREASGEVLILESADTLPLPTTIEQLVKPFADPEVGMVGGHPVPMNNKDTFMGFAGRLTWELHHQVSLCHPKCGELVAWRNTVPRIPISAVDEASIEALIVNRGLKLAYAPEAIVYNCTPRTVSDFVKQRRRIWAGHLKMRKAAGYSPSTMSTRRVLRILLKSVKWDIKSILWTGAVVLLEQYARSLGTYDVLVRKKDHTIWDMVSSTKVLDDDTYSRRTSHGSIPA